MMRLHAQGCRRASRVIDYTREDFTRGGGPYDLLLDIAGNRSWSECVRVLAPDATVVLVGGPKTNRWFGPLGHFVGTRVKSVPGRRRAVPFIATVDSAAMNELRELLETGRLTPVIDRTCPLNEAGAALTYLGEGHAPGKVVLTV